MLRLTLLTLFILPTFAMGEPVVSFDGDDKRLAILIDGKPFATYVTSDEKIRRPYFMHLHSPAGLPVTRNSPPKDKDPTDHDTMHPGLWLSFGDLSGADFWRNKGVTEHIEFRRKQAPNSSVAWLTTVNRYKFNDRTVAEEVSKATILAEPHHTWMILKSTFTHTAPMTFGDQEEMGLGVRVATPLTVKNGGTILNSKGLKNEKNAWGQTAEWCSYSGTIDGKKVGIAIFTHPKNFRESWFHVRDYGLMVANPFGRQAFTKGEPSRLTIPANEPFNLGFGVLVYDAEPDLKAMYQEYLKKSE